MAYPHGAYLAPPDFSKRFRAAWDAAQSRFFKIERRQSYNQAGDESFDAFSRGETERAAALLRDGILTQREMYGQAVQKGLELVRLRLVEEPLSDYLRSYEIPSYFVSEGLGERVYMAPVDRDHDALPDCIIFDEQVMFVNAYDGLNRLVGAIEITDHGEIAKHITIGEKLLSAAEPLADFVAARDLC